MSQGKFCFRVVLPLEPGRVVSGESRRVAAWTIREGRVAACRCEGVGASVPREGRCEGVGASVPREGRGTSLGLWPAQPTRGGCSVCVLGPAQGEPDSLLACVLTDCTFVMEREQTHPPSTQEAQTREAGQPPGKLLTRHAEGARPRVRARPGVEDRCARPGVEDRLPGQVGGACSWLTQPVRQFLLPGNQPGQTARGP